MAIATWTVTLVFSVFSLLRKTSEALSETIVELQREVASLNTSLRHLHKSVSRILHGPVQEAITSVLIRVESRPEQTSDGELTELLKSRLEEAFEQLSSPTLHSVDVREVLTELQEVWEGVVDIAFTLSEKHQKVISQSPGTASAVADMAREACSNAIRHGNATHITIAIALKNKSQDVALTVRNNGAPLPSSPTPGLGTDMFNDVTLNWSRSQRGSEVVVSAIVPLTL